MPRDRPIIAIGYKYNAQKVLSFIATEVVGSTKAGIDYLSKYPGPFANGSISPVACPLGMPNFLGLLMKLTLTINPDSPIQC